jgi:hypothetical protein
MPTRECTSVMPRHPSRPWLVSLRAIDLCLTLFNIAILPELFASAGFFLLIHGYDFINIINHQVSKWSLFLASSFGHA